MDPVIKLSKILRADHDVVENICGKMGKLTGKKDILTKIIVENDRKVKEKLNALGLPQNPYDFEVYNALIDHLRNNDRNIFELFRYPVCTTHEGCKTLLNFALELADIGKGYFLKKQKAEEFLRKKPPLNIIGALGYKDVDELLEKEDLFEVFSALRFAEKPEWLNNEFFKQYESLEPADFEERKVMLKVLQGKWLLVAEKFLEKKYHNVSHLKELGIIFIIPLELKVSGETMRIFTLLLHYLHEIKFYSDLFRFYSKNNGSFAENIVSSLRGDVTENPLPDEKSISWRIVQRYLAKDDEFDHRLFEPHINPEAIHWTKAEDDLARLGKRFPDLGLEFWQGLDFVGDFFKTQGGTEVLVSFNLIDTVMSLVKEKEMVKYLYHHQEAMWNKIFSEFMDWEKMEKMIVENLRKGYVSL